MSKSRILPSRSINNNNSTLNNASIAPVAPISGEMNSTKDIEDSIIYEGGITSTAEVIVDNLEEKIYAIVIKVPHTFSVETETGNVVTFDGSEDKRIKLSGYEIRELTAQPDELRRYALYRSDSTQVGDTIVVPKDADLQQALTDEINNRIDADASLRQELLELINNLADTKEDKETYITVAEEEFTTFTFADNTEVSYVLPVDKNISLNVPNTVKQGFISLLTLLDMGINRTITINNHSRFPLRIVSGSTYVTSNEFITSIQGKKVIFARCDGLSLEILIFEEIPMD